ncbi:hypothetical protein TNCV_4763881 [Trichonephila clavipes]|nr:hypothetical protein TNCV_4763881 [Trichonephila clavipes]
MNGTPVVKKEKGQLLVPVLLITVYHKRETVRNGSMYLSITEDAKLLSWFCRWRVFHTVSCKLQNQSFSLDRSAVVDEPRIGRSSVELKPLHQLRPLGREQDMPQAT